MLTPSIVVPRMVEESVWSVDMFVFAVVSVDKLHMREVAGGLGCLQPVFYLAFMQHVE